LVTFALAQMDGSASPEGPNYFDLLERNTHIIYPALGVLALVLIIAGILQAWRSQDLAGLEKAELKRELIIELRRQAGCSASGEQLAKAIGLDAFKTMKLLEELQRDGVLQSHTNTQRLTVWRLKSLASGR
jgi:hypothetical protein